MQPAAPIAAESRRALRAPPRAEGDHPPSPLLTLLPAGCLPHLLSLSYVRRGPPLLVSASDDSTVLLWDLRAKGSQQTIAEKFAVRRRERRRRPRPPFPAAACHLRRRRSARLCPPATSLDSPPQVTAVVFSDGSDRVFTGSIDNEIRCWDLRKNEVAYSLAGHTDTITVRAAPAGAPAGRGGRASAVWAARPERRPRAVRRLYAARQGRV